jgi:glycerol-3-phosphate acyltransferase PlsY
MKPFWLWPLCGLLAYLLGAIPIGLLVSRLKGVDIRRVGSGNIGATNVYRSVSKGLGVFTFAGDAVKGWLPVWLAMHVAPWEAPAPAQALAAAGLLCGCLAIVGHNWPIYLGFKGGKGVSTSAGVLLGVAPQAMAVGLVVWVMLVALTRYVSVASIGAALGAAGGAWWLYRQDGLLLPAALTVLAALVVWRHRGNIQRLRNGTEHRFGRKPDSAAPAGPAPEVRT